MVKVVVSAIHRLGDEDVHVEFITVEAEQPRVEPRVTKMEEMELSKVAEYVTGAVTAALQRSGQISNPSRPKMALFLTMAEYESMGRPQINEVFDLVFGQMMKGDVVQGQEGPVIAFRRSKHD